MYRISRDNPRFSRELDIIKFICKDFWSYCFNKPQCDKLQTNHKGTYVIHDFNHSWINKISGKPTHLTNNFDHLIPVALLYLNLAAGVMKGALKNLGKNTLVNVEIVSYPHCMCTFLFKHIQQKQNKTKHGTKKVV